MKKHEKELYSAIAKAERMSGFDSYDGAEGDMSAFDDMDGFDGDDMSFFDDDAQSYATGPRAVAISDPYVIQYFNTIAVNTPAVLFGYNDNFGALNFGNAATVTITNLQGGTYGRLLAQSNNKFFKIGKWRFQSGSPAQLQQTYSLVHFDANGKQYSTPLNLSIMKDAYQFQNDIIDVAKICTIDGNTSVTFTLVASATLVISMFPIAVISGKAKLNGGTSVNTAKAPRLSGKNTAPVIIQTSQDVRGISKG
jgi:hypothetical protein